LNEKVKAKIYSWVGVSYDPDKELRPGKKK
jgi:hypothetical protein